MRHAKRVKKLGRTKEHRKAMLANMAASILANIQIRTTLVKAKEVRKVVENLITLGKRGDLHAHRLAYDVIRDRKLVKKLFDEIAPEFKDRTGGYTRVLKLGRRRGDGAHTAVVELLMKKPAVVEKEKGKKEKGKAKAKAPTAPVKKSKEKKDKKEENPGAKPKAKGKKKKDED
ncbi:MAG: 50S ribosomal protein L17 [Candidatus Zixiibacteriota bacterium]